MIVCIIYNIFKVDAINRIPHLTHAYEGNLNVDRHLNLRKFSYMFKKIEKWNLVMFSQKMKTENLIRLQRYHLLKLKYKKCLLD